MKDIYEDDIGLQIVRANREGDIAFLKQMVAEQQFDPRHVTEVEHWNYLHRTNLINPSPKETIQFYLEHGVPVNAQDCYGMTPLHYAVREHNYDAVKLLLEAGEDPNIENKDDTTAIRQTISQIPLKEDIPIIELLIQYGAEPYKKNSYGMSLLDSAKLSLMLKGGSSEVRSLIEKLVEKLEENIPSDYVPKDFSYLNLGKK